MIKTLGLTLAAAGMMTITAQAVPITGGISFFGAYTPQDSAAATTPDLACNTDRFWWHSCGDRWNERFLLRDP